MMQPNDAARMINEDVDLFRDLSNYSHKEVGTLTFFGHTNDSHVSSENSNALKCFKCFSKMNTASIKGRM